MASPNYLKFKNIIFTASDKVTMPDALGHAVGPERFELLAKLAGNEVCSKPCC